jgi:hypothetical protein
MKILFLNHKEKQCGVYQYGKRFYDIINYDDRYQVIYFEIGSEKELFDVISEKKPNIIVYNWHKLTLPWLNRRITDQLKSIPQLIIYHESVRPNDLHYDYLLMVDMSENLTNKEMSMPRPIFDIEISKVQNEIPIIGSFGFGFDNKGFDKICSLVQSSFDEAIIHLHITNAFFGDRNSIISNKVIDRCRNIIYKPKIKLKVTTNFLDDYEILQFLSNNSVNIFLYDDMIGRGLSSVIDYAVSVNTPLVVNNSYMFRHIINDKPNISIEKNDISTIIGFGIEPIIYFREKWSNQNFRDKFYKIIKNL